MTTALLFSVLLLVGNAFFVAAEFALVASKRHRLEDLAERGSLAARAAVRGSRELSLMLAGAQLGITLCTLGLGSLAKPAVAELLQPVFTFLRLPDAAAYVVSVVLAVAIVVFLHMVVGEMAPKSWAIAHPERSALMLALPFRAFARVMRPVLALLNAMANGCLRLVGVQPQDELAQVHGPKELEMLLQSSREHGLLAEPEHRVLAGAIDLDTTPLSDVLVPLAHVVGVGATATCAEAETVSRESGRSRLLVRDRDVPVGIVHVRDVVRSAASAPVTAVTAPALQVDAGLSLLDAVSLMRSRQAQLVLVEGPQGPVGIVTMEDLLERVLGRFDDETDA
ncbi:hemolysin family protein [Intrasporangium mesophilum]